MEVLALILGLIQARTGSTRLPGKIFMEFSGKPDLFHVYNRANKSKMIDKVIIATTDEKSDDRVLEYCKKENIECFRGSEDDVLDRFYQCCKQQGLSKKDMVVRITADCPLIDPFIIDQVIKYFLENDFDYLSNALEPTYPDGLDVEVFLFSALEKSWEEAKLPSEREHVTPYIRNNEQLFKIGSYKNSTDLSHYRWTLDEIEDYQLISIIYEKLYSQDDVFNTEDILSFLNDNPQLIEINNKYARNEGFLKSLEADKKIESGDLNE
nr:glycosyltransferase family protein [uncultured Acetobacterium sp.]